MRETTRKGVTEVGRGTAEDEKGCGRCSFTFPEAAGAEGREVRRALAESTRSEVLRAHPCRQLLINPKSAGVRVRLRFPKPRAPNADRSGLPRFPNPRAPKVDRSGDRLPNPRAPKLAISMPATTIQLQTRPSSLPGLSLGFIESALSWASKIRKRCGYVLEACEKRWSEAKKEEKNVWMAEQ